MTTNKSSDNSTFNVLNEALETIRGTDPSKRKSTKRTVEFWIKDKDLVTRFLEKKRANIKRSRESLYFFEEEAALDIHIKTEVEMGEHEHTRKYIAEKIDGFVDELASKDDIIKAKSEIITKMSEEAEEIKQSMEGQISDLKRNLLRFLPYKRTFKVAFYFNIFFSFSILSKFTLGVTIVETFWALLGLTVSAGFLLMSYIMFLDWNKDTR